MNCIGKRQIQSLEHILRKKGLPNATLMGEIEGKRSCEEGLKAKDFVGGVDGNQTA